MSVNHLKIKYCGHLMMSDVSTHMSAVWSLSGCCLKGTATLMISIFYMKERYEPLIFIPVSSKSVEKYGSYGCLNICKWTLMEAAIL